MGKGIADLMADLQSENDRVRFKSFQVLHPIAREDPHRLLPWWEVLEAMLDKPEVSNKYYAIVILPHLVRADRHNRFDGVLERFLALLEHESPVVAPNAAGMAGVIVNARPDTEALVVEKLLATEQTCQCRHRDLFMSYVIKALDECFDRLSDREAARAFVSRQLSSSSPKTRKAARAYLDKRA